MSTQKSAKRKQRLIPRTKGAVPEVKIHNHSYSSGSTFILQKKKMNSSKGSKVRLSVLFS